MRTRETRMRRACMRFAFEWRNRALGSRPVQIDAPIPIKLHPYGAVAFEYWSRRDIERHGLEVVRAIVRPGMTFVDIGSNAGLYALTVAVSEPGARVYAFEPCPSTLHVLERNIEINRAWQVVVVPFAVGDERGMSLTQENKAGWDSPSMVGAPSPGNGFPARTAMVETVRLDDFLPQEVVERVDLMRIDVGGAEHLVLRGARRLLEREDGPIILFENAARCTRAFGYHPVENVWYLRALGYQVCAVDPMGSGLVPYPRSEDASALALAFKPHSESWLPSGWLSLA